MRTAPQVEVSSGATDNYTFRFTDCIFSGVDADDTAFRVFAGDNNTVDLINCALVGIGPDRLSGTPIVFSGGSGNASSEVNTVVLEPTYVSRATSPWTSDSFDVDNVAYGGLGSAGSDLSGYGDFIGAGVPVELSVFRAD